MMRVLIIVAPLFFLSFSVISLPILPEQISQLPSDGVLISQFTQTKQLQGIPQPLSTQGKIIFWQGHGIIWQTLNPFLATVVMTSEGIHHLENEELIKAAAPQQQKLFSLISKFMSGPISNLEGFEISAHSNGDDQWTRVLTPIHPNLQQMLKSITLNGDIHLNRVVIERTTGDVDVIEFTEHKVGDSHLLNHSEQAWLQNG